MKRRFLLVVPLIFLGATWSYVAQAQQAPAAGAAAAPAAPAGGFGGGPGGPGGGFGGPGAPGGRAGGRGGRGGFGAPVPPGPPAPVPAVVAIPRPTPDEITTINNEISRLVEGDSSPAKPLLVKYQTLLTVTAPRANPAASFTMSGVRPDGEGSRHQGFVEQAKKGDVDVLFEGDSITDFWQQAGAQGGAEVLKKHFGDWKLANFAISGDTTQGLLWGLKNGEGRDGETPVKMQPKAIMLMIGTNNTGSNTGPEIAEGVGAVVMELRRDFPNAKILLLAIFPRGTGPTDANRIKNEQANQLIAKLDDKQHIFFKSINDKFLKPDGSLIGFRGDNLHPNAEGYELWANAVKDTLAGWLK